MLLIRQYHVEQPFSSLFLVISISCVFQHDEWLVGPFEGKHFHVNSIFILYCLREQFFAYFTLQFREVIRNGNSIDFSLDSAADPVLQAAYMHQLATSFAIARTNQWVRLGTLLAETDLALPFDFHPTFVYSFVHF